MELLIRVQDRAFKSRAQFVDQIHRGEVVAIMQDGHQWSARERESPAWRIIRLDLTQVEADALLQSEFDIADTKTHLWTRQRGFDFDHIDMPTRLKIKIDEARIDEIVTTSANEKTDLLKTAFVRGAADIFVAS